MQPAAKKMESVLQLPSEDVGLGIAQGGGSDGDLDCTQAENLCSINQKARLKDNAFINVLHPALISVCGLGSSGLCSISVSSHVVFLHVVGRDTQFVAAVCITLSSRRDMV